MSLLLRAAFLFLYTVAAQAPFVYLDDARDAATNQRGIAPGAMFILRGTFGIPMGLRTAPFPLPTAFAGISLTLTSIASPDAPPVRPYIFYTYATLGSPQLAAILPSDTPPGRYRQTITVGNTSSTSGTATVVERKFRLLANNNEGYGLAVAQSAQSAPTRLDRVMFSTGLLPNGVTKSPAQPGQTILLWGTGLGPIAAPDNLPTGILDLRRNLDVRVSIGGIAAPVHYAGRAPANPGIDLLNITLPLNVPTGCNVALEVTVNGVPSNPVTLAIAPHGAAACLHPVWTAAELEALDQGETRLAGRFHFMVYSEPYLDIPLVQIHSAIGYFGNLSATDASMLSPASVFPGQCVAFRGTPTAIGVGMGSPLFLDAGADDSYDAGRVNVTGAMLPAVPLTGDDDYYYQLFSAFRDDTAEHITGIQGRRFTLGPQILSAAGGRDIGPFQVTLDMPPNLVWTNRLAVQEVNRNLPLTLTFTGAGPRDIVFSQAASGEGPDITTYLCAAAPGANSITIPPSILRALEPGSGAVRVAAFSAAPAVFNAPVLTPAKPGPGTLHYLFMTTQFVTFK